MSRKGCEAAPAFFAAMLMSGAALRPFRDTRPLPQRLRKPSDFEPHSNRVIPQLARGLRRCQNVPCRVTMKLRGSP
ncbi:hypothetical protein D3C76_1757680 [compost metagenome]